MTGERTIRDAIRRADASVPDELTADPDTILDRDCVPCKGTGLDDTRPEHICMACGSTGREVVNVIVAVAPDEWELISANRRHLITSFRRADRRTAAPVRRAASRPEMSRTAAIMDQLVVDE